MCTNEGRNGSHHPSSPPPQTQSPSTTQFNPQQPNQQELRALGFRPPDLRAAADAVRLARRTLRTIHGNLFWAFGYNVAALPLAAAALLSPMLAGAAMALSSVFVLSNALRLKRNSFKPQKEAYDD